MSLLLIVTVMWNGGCTYLQVKNYLQLKSLQIIYKLQPILTVIRLFPLVRHMFCCCVCVCVYSSSTGCLDVCMFFGVITCHRLWVWFISGSRRWWRSPISLQNYNYHVSRSASTVLCRRGHHSYKESFNQSAHACAPCQTPVYSRSTVDVPISSWSWLHNLMWLWQATSGIVFVFIPRPGGFDILVTVVQITKT